MDEAVSRRRERDTDEHTGFVPSTVVRYLDRLPEADTARLEASGWGGSKVEDDHFAELNLGVVGVTGKTRDAMAVCAAVPAVTSRVFLLESQSQLRVVVSPPNARSPTYGPRQLFVLDPGQWARWRFNGRFVPDGCTCHAHQWWYETS